jgi:hypothetical protein
MYAYEFRRERETALTVDRDGINLPGGLVWTPTAVIDPAELRGDIASVLDEIGFFIWP